MALRSSPEQRRYRSSAIALTGLLSTLVLAGPVAVTVTDGAGRALPEAVVFLDSPRAKAAVQPLQAVEIVQADKAFQPAVTVVTVGTSVRFPNRDTVRHHVYSFSPTKRFDLKLYVGTPAQPVVFDKSGVAVLGCNIHDNMVAWVVVVDTPWFGTTNAAGVAQLPDIPPGTYTLRTWHTALPVGAAVASQSLTVGADPVRVSMRLSLP